MLKKRAVDVKQIAEISETAVQSNSLNTLSSSDDIQELPTNKKNKQMEKKKPIKKKEKEVAFEVDGVAYDSEELFGTDEEPVEKSSASSSSSSANIKRKHTAIETVQM